jgi:hypothetical protein
MSDLMLVLHLRYRRWRSTERYWLQVLGVNVDDQDIFARLYLLYVVILGVVWLAVAGSGVITLAYRVGRPLPTPIAADVPAGLAVAAAAVVTFGTFRAPMLLDHGDLEWLAPSPISRRALAIPHVVGTTLWTWGLSAAVLSVGLTFLHRPATLAEAALVAWLFAAARGVGWALAALRWSSAERPSVWGWLGVPAAQLAIGWFAPAPALAPFRTVWTAAAGGSWAAAWHTSLGAAVGGLVAAVLAAGALNLATVQEASGLYADIRSLGTTYLPNPALVQDLRDRFRLSRRRVLGRLPAWQLPYLEGARYFWSQVRDPRQALRFLAMASLIRTALLVVFLPHTATSWLLWLFLAYRFRRARLTLYASRDLADPFLRQFWPDTAVQRLVSAGLLPTVWIVALAMAIWRLLPLGVPFTALRVVWLAGLVATWYLAEGGGAVRQWVDGYTAADGHEVAIGGVGLYLLVSAGMGQPAEALAIPGLLLLWWIAGMPSRLWRRTVS